MPLKMGLDAKRTELGHGAVHNTQTRGLIQYFLHQPVLLPVEMRQVRGEITSIWKAKENGKNSGNVRGHTKAKRDY